MVSHHGGSTGWLHQSCLIDILWTTGILGIHLACCVAGMVFWGLYSWGRVVQVVKRCRVKVCGITSVADAQMVCAAGVDAIGLVFYEKSSRNVTIEQAAEICTALPPFVSAVGLFLDAPETFVNEVLDAVPLDVLQFHGSETPEYCNHFRRPYIKGLGMKGVTGDNFRELANQYPTAQGLAGGLSPDNVAKAICTTQVYAVDVSSGVESAPGGIKDNAMIAAFMDEVHQANQMLQAELHRESRL